MTATLEKTAQTSAPIRENVWSGDFKGTYRQCQDWVVVLGYGAYDQKHDATLFSHNSTKFAVLTHGIDLKWRLKEYEHVPTKKEIAHQRRDHLI